MIFMRSSSLMFVLFSVPRTGTADQLARAVGLPDVFLSGGEGGGVIQGSASEGTLVGLLAARTRALRFMRRVSPGVSDHELIAKMTIYTSDQVSERARNRGEPLSRPASASSTRDASHGWGFLSGRPFFWSETSRYLLFAGALDGKGNATRGDGADVGFAVRGNA